MAQLFDGAAYVNNLGRKGPGIPNGTSL